MLAYFVWGYFRRQEADIELGMQIECPLVGCGDPGGDGGDAMAAMPLEHCRSTALAVAVILIEWCDHIEVPLGFGFVGSNNKEACQTDAIQQLQQLLL